MADEKPQATVRSENKSQERRNPLAFSEAILLATVSAGVYLFAFLYERGFTSYFGIPNQFVNVNLITLLIFGVGTFTILFVTVGLVDMFFPFIPKHPYLAFYVPRLTVSLFVFVLIPFFLLEGKRGWFFLSMFVIWLATVFILLILPLLTKRKEEDWVKIYDVEMEREIRQSPPGPGLYYLIGSRFGVKNLGLLLVGIYYCTLLARMAGEAEAINQKEFLVLNTIPEMVVLRISGENMICAPFDRNAHEVKKSFSIRKMAEDPKLVMNLESVGPLKPVEKLSIENASPSPSPTPELTPSITPAPPSSSPSPGASPVDSKPIVN